MATPFQEVVGDTAFSIYRKQRMVNCLDPYLGNESRNVMIYDEVISDTRND
jgi:hypothetical protein